MRYLVIAALFLAGVARAAPEIDIQPSGPYVRGQVITFRAYANDEVEGLSRLALEISDPIDGFGPGFPYPARLVGPGQGDLVQPGDLVECGEVVSPRADQPAPLLGPYDYSRSPAPYRVTYAGTAIDGPGPLFSFAQYTPIDAATFQAVMDAGAPRRPMQGPGITVVSAANSLGKQLHLDAQAPPVAVDFRLFGDLDGDGRLTPADAALLLRAVLGLAHPDPVTTWYADVEPTGNGDSLMPNGRHLGDGQLTVKDVIRLLQVMAGQWPGWWPDPIPGRGG